MQIYNVIILYIVNICKSIVLSYHAVSRYTKAGKEVFVAKVDPDITLYLVLSSSFGCSR